jgi:YVTN family beta-propeller protein
MRAAAWILAVTVAVVPGPMNSGRSRLHDGWTISPLGKPVEVGTLPLAMVALPGRQAAVAICGYAENGVDIVNFETGARERLEMPKAWYGLAASRDGRTLYASAGADNSVAVFRRVGRRWRAAGSIALGSPEAKIFPAGLFLDETRGLLYVCENLAAKLAVVDLKKRAVVSEAATGPDPYDVRVLRDGSRAFVSNWGGASISEIPLTGGGRGRRIPTGAHPTALLLDSSEIILYVACAQDDFVSVIDLAAGREKWRVSVTLSPGDREGATPTSLALSRDGKRLFVADSDDNDVAVIDVASRPPRVAGFLPSGRYPTAVALGADGALLVSDGKGSRAFANPKGPRPDHPTPGWKGADYVLRVQVGDVREIPARELAPAALARHTARVLENRPAAPAPPPPSAAYSKIRHVIYVIKENRTYDQVLGDDPRGNGDPSLVLFGEKSSPNHHALAREFTLIDNFYCNAEVSADGHNWSTAAFSNEYVQRLYPQTYSHRGRDYDYAGDREIARPREGYLWDAAARAGLPYRSYGEFVENGRAPEDPEFTRIPALQGHFDPKYRAFDTDYPDRKRLAEWLSEFREFERNGGLPSLEIIHLPNDHTAGTRAGARTPRAMMADNDEALGGLVEAVTRSRYFADTAIFVVEDDAQNGPDHVDCHRSLAFVVSPYTPRGMTDSRMYSTTSVLATIERILGLAPLSQYDERAPRMDFEFSGPIDPRPYAARPEVFSPDEENASGAPMASESRRLDLSREDEEPEDLLNDILYAAIQGRQAPAPVVRFGVR